MCGNWIEITALCEAFSKHEVQALLQLVCLYIEETSAEKFFVKSREMEYSDMEWQFYRGLEPSQTCSVPPPGAMLGRYKISLMSSYLELGHVCATWKGHDEEAEEYI